ncbi:MAG TPA: putative metal-dependent hydrolase [Bryobacteraceae bacterium]|nr:putative metal-dependent hydrolase [Bryobacteraceae bacterium]
MDPRFPIGPFEMPASLDAAARGEFLHQLRAAPERFRAAIHGLHPAQLDTPYRAGGWTVRQVIHHVPDSHASAYVRFRLALTEDEPTIKPYNEAAWAELADARTAPVEPSLALLGALHSRWVALIETLPEAAFSRAYRHPEQGRVTLGVVLAMYAWHCRHHEAHITALRERMGWK